MLLACGRDEDSAAPAPLTCTERFTGSAPATEADIVALVASARAGFFPTLGALSLEVSTMESVDRYFVANLDLATISEAPLERDDRVLYSSALFADPPECLAVGAILVHELKHVLDYTALEADALVEFGLWYASGDDISDDEKQTDEYALESGCAAGLSAYQEWVYAHIPEEEKQETDYTPAELAAWVAEHE